MTTISISKEIAQIIKENKLDWMTMDDYLRLALGVELDQEGEMRLKRYNQKISDAAFKKPRGYGFTKIEAGESVIVDFEHGEDLGRAIRQHEWRTGKVFKTAYTNEYNKAEVIRLK